MFKVSTTLCLVGASLSLMSVSASGLLLQSFENGDLNSPQLARLGGQSVAGTEGFSALGVTDGVASYGVQGQEAAAGAGAKEYIEIVLDAAGRAALVANPTLMWDTTVAVDDDPSDSSVDSDTFFTTVAGIGLGYNFHGSFNRESVAFGGGPVTTSYTFTQDEIDIYSNPAQTFVVFRFGLNSDPGVSPTAYFDNIRLVPEPASAALLGLGGLAMLRRRR